MMSCDCAESKQGDKQTIIPKSIDAATGGTKDTDHRKGMGKLSTKELKYTCNSKR